MNENAIKVLSCNPKRGMGLSSAGGNMDGLCKLIVFVYIFPEINNKTTN